MLSSNGNSYLRPEYLNPPPTTTMDSKKSPLALLAQTCSQIGADPQIPASKNSSVQSTSERKKSVSESQRDKSSPLSVGGSSDSGSTTNNRVQQPASSASSNNNEPKHKKSAESERRQTPDRRSKSISPKNPNRNSSGSGSSTMTQSIDGNLSNGLMSHPSLQQQQQQQQHPLMMAAAAAGNDPSSAAMSLASYKSLMAAGMGSPYSAAGYPPYSTAGFGAGLPPGYPSHMDLGAYASALNAVAKSSMPFPSASSAAAMMSGYLAAQHPAYSAALAMQYGRMKNPSLFTAPATTPTDGGTCRDPYCTGCPSNNNNNNNNPTAGSGGMHMICAAGCGLGVQCDHLKVPIPAHHLTAGPASSPLAPPSSPLNAANNKPYVCNWIVGDNYCGKRFGSSDELLQHLRTHTNLSSAAGNEPVGLSTNNSIPPTSSSAVHPSAAFAHPSSLMRAYPTPPLSPLSAARYHPYGKNPAAGQQQHPSPQQSQGPPGFPPGLFHPHHPALAGMAGSSPYPPPGLFHHPALAPYYSHLSLFAPRGLGSAPLPP